MSFEEIPSDKDRSVEDDEGNVRPKADFVSEPDDNVIDMADYEPEPTEEEQALIDALQEEHQLLDSPTVPAEVADVLRRRQEEELKLKNMGLREDRIKVKLVPFVIEIAKLSARGIDVSAAFPEDKAPEPAPIDEETEKKIDDLVNKRGISYFDARMQILGRG